mmetsp:Transcript_7949/g.24997  ORF Transcript_7949/g.24997 Transcript_7949/m.24997 type:complete len:118 (-) Transcript_7949:175-528(-)
MTANEGKDDDSDDENDAVSDDGFVYAKVEVVSVEGTDSDDEDERRKEVLCLGEEDRQNGGSEASPSLELTEEKVEDVNNSEKKKKKKKRKTKEGSRELRALKRAFVWVQVCSRKNPE